MLLRNLDTASGACNGTRLIVNNITTRVIDATIINGSHANQRYFIPRIPLSPETNILPIKFTRLQFPVRPAFAMTINKSQGQHIRSDGIVFTKTSICSWTIECGINTCYGLEEYTNICYKSWKVSKR